MHYPIVKVKTEDDLILRGMLFEPERNNRKIIKIHIHGDAGDFFWSDFYPPLMQDCLGQGMASLSTNNRGAWVFENSSDEVVPHGVAAELFSDCVKDLDAWIEFALDRGYEKIILEAHSRGTEKVVYYMNHGQYVDKIIGVILLGFSDAVGTQLNYEKKIGKNFIAEAKELLKQGKGDHLLSDLRCFAGELPMTANSYLDFMGPNSANTKALPLRQGKNLNYFRKINCPILAVIGDKFEYTVIPILQALELLKKENSLAETYQLENCDHNFTGKEVALAKIIANWQKRKII